MNWKRELFFCVSDFEGCATQPGKIHTVEVPAASLGSELAVYLPFFHPAKY